MTETHWEAYESVATYLLNYFAEYFGLWKVEGKQIVAGESGTAWEIDGKGYRKDCEAFVIVECKRKTTRKAEQEIVAGLAFRILDTGASSGIIVTPIGYQEGAKKVANHVGIHMVLLNKDCTSRDFILAFLNKIFMGIPGRNFSALGKPSIGLR